MTSPEVIIPPEGGNDLSAVPVITLCKGYTNIYFAENQLSANQICLSLLHTPL